MRKLNGFFVTVAMLLLLAGSLSLIGCNISVSPKLQPIDYSFTETGTVSMATQYKEYAPGNKQLNWTIKNDSDSEIIYGSWYEVVMEKNGKWYHALPYTENGEYAWDALAHLLEPQSATSYVLYDVDRLEEGTYRLVKEFDHQYYYAEFKISEHGISGADARKTDDPENFMTLTRSGALSTLTGHADGKDTVVDYYLQDLWGGRPYFTVNETEDRYGYIITDGTDLYASNVFSFDAMDSYPFLETPYVKVVENAGEEACSIAADMESSHHDFDLTEAFLWSPDHIKYLTFAGPHSAGYEKCDENGSMGEILFDLPEETITDAYWIDADNFVFVLENGGETREMKYNLTENEYGRPTLKQ